MFEIIPSIWIIKGKCIRLKRGDFTTEEIISNNYQIKIQLIEDKRAYSAGRHSIDMYGYFGVLKTTST